MRNLPSVRPSIPPALLEVVLLAVVLLAGFGLRVRFFGGFGLADDGIFWNEVKTIIVANTVQPDNQAYRFTWWLPVAVVARAFGVTEPAMVAPFLVYSLAGILLVYAIARQLWGPWAGMVAAALLAVHPMDVTWATIMTNDFAMSCFSALAVLCTLRALDADDQSARRRNWIGAGLALVLCYHSKVTGLILVPVVASIVWLHRHRARDVDRLLLAMLVLFGASALAIYALSGSVLAPMHMEFKFQGILDASSAVHRQVNWYVLRFFPDVLFVPNHLGDRLNAWYPHALGVLALLAWPLGLRVGGSVWVWLALVFLAMEFNIQRVGGYWVSGARNVRHAHVFVYPIVLLLAGYLAALRARRPALALAVTIALVGSAAIGAVSAATKTHVAFADGRAACRFLSTLPPSTIYLDPALDIRCTHTMPEVLTAWTIVRLSDEAPGRDSVLKKATAGYVVTGGGREPICCGTRSIPLASELPPGAELVSEVSGPVDPTWRPEPLRIWKLRDIPAS
ncbi:MAG TPA: glycosyltransferase family 39 protein [Candidatus Limnocylindria bacterium]|nr:glycosyltransferase family 39 protein [Candidatus Limnocylindria bacterium]